MCQRIAKSADGPIGWIVIETDVEGTLPPELRDDVTLVQTLERLARGWEAGGCCGACLKARQPHAAEPRTEEGTQLAMNRGQLLRDLELAARRVHARAALSSAAGR